MKAGYAAPASKPPAKVSNHIVGPAELNVPTIRRVEIGMQMASTARRPTISAIRPPTISPSEAGVAVHSVNNAIPPPV